MNRVDKSIIIIAMLNAKNKISTHPLDPTYGIQYFPLTPGSQRYTVSHIKKTGMVHRTPIYISMHG